MQSVGPDARESVHVGLPFDGTPTANALQPRHDPGRAFPNAQQRTEHWSEVSFRSDHAALRSHGRSNGEPQVPKPNPGWVGEERLLEAVVVAAVAEPQRR